MDELDSLDFSKYIVGLCTNTQTYEQYTLIQFPSTYTIQMLFKNSLTEENIFAFRLIIEGTETSPWHWM